MKMVTFPFSLHTGSYRVEWTNLDNEEEKKFNFEIAMSVISIMEIEFARLGVSIHHCLGKLTKFVFLLYSGLSTGGSPTWLVQQTKSADGPQCWPQGMADLLRLHLQQTAPCRYLTDNYNVS